MLRTVFGNFGSCALAVLLVTCSGSASADEVQVGLDGYCPVDLIDNRSWTEGSGEHAAVYDGREYRLSSESAKARFLGNPNKYVPALHGDCVVEFGSNRVRTAGELAHASFYNGRLYLFASADAKTTFAQEPLKYAKADIAYDGLCSVCLIEAQIRKPGTTRHVAHYRGLRYLFPNQILVKKFYENPVKYQDPKFAEMRTAVKAAPAVGSQVDVTGLSTCAMCEFGVTAVGAPNELGLAVKADSGFVYVVEDAHTKYPELYEDRDGEPTVRLRGKVIKRDGKFAWVSPTSLKATEELAAAN